jgi:hypothetical protein
VTPDMDRALSARELADYAVVARCFDPDRPRRYSQVIPLDKRQRIGFVDRAVYLVPRPSRLHHALSVVGQAVAAASLVVTGVLCLAAMLFFLWGVTQAFALLIRALLRIAP